MQNPLQVTFHDMKHNEEIETLIADRFEKIKVISPNITKCHVIIEKQSKHHQKANTASVKLDLKVSHFDDIVISEKCEEDHGSVQSAVLKVFKRGQLMVREELKHRRDIKRAPRADAFVPEVVDETDEE